MFLDKDKWDLWFRWLTCPWATSIEFLDGRYGNHALTRIALNVAKWIGWIAIALIVVNSIAWQI